MLKNKFILILICALVFISISSVCASEENVTVESDSNPSIEGNSFEDLKNDISNINPGDVYNMDRDYTFDANTPGSKSTTRMLSIDKDNVTINGNGHVIDGSNKAAFFRITGNNVKIFNLTFINGKSFSVSSAGVWGEFTPEQQASLGKFEKVIDFSPICWMGSNGEISDCILQDNTAINGGAMTWMGSNGIINNIKFINNTATGIGGAIYIGGLYNNISNCMFINSTSLLSGEAIYVDRIHKNISLSNVSFKQDIFVIDGSYNGIDVDYLTYSCYYQVADKYIDLIPFVYKTIMNSGAIYIDGQTYGIARNPFFKDGNYTVFTLNIFREFKEDNIIYEKNYLFHNQTFNEVFKSILNREYRNSFAVFKNLYVKDLTDYENTCNANANILVYNTKSMDIIRTDIFKNLEKSDNILHPLTCCFNVTFAPGSVFNSNSKFNPDGFNVVNINGNGARIKAVTEKDDEYTWLENNGYYSISDLTIDGFNHGIVNLGKCMLNNTHFENNHIVYKYEKEDWGAGILNVGICNCFNCTFTNNVANSGGAIFNQGQLTLEKTTFHCNNVEGSFLNSLTITTGGYGVDVCNSKGLGTVISAEKMDYTDIDGFDSYGVPAIIALGSAMISFISGAATGYIFGSIKAGMITGAVTGFITGVLGSLVVYYHAMDVTYDPTVYSICLITGSMILGAIGGYVGGCLAKYTPLSGNSNSPVQQNENGIIVRTEEGLNLWSPGAYDL